MAELEFNDQDSQMDLHDLTFSETSLDQFPELPMSSPAPLMTALFCSGCDICSKSECPVEKIKKRNGIGHGTSTRIIWGKTSKKSKKGRRDKKQMLKNVRGNLFCGFAKNFLKKLRYKRLMRKKQIQQARIAKSKDNNAANNLLNIDLRRDSDFKES